MLTLLPQFTETLSVRFFHKGDDFSPPANCVRLKQVHGNKTIRVHGPMNTTEQADGMITDVPNLPLLIRVADCQSFAVYAPEKKIIGALHAGWRGLLAGAIEEFFAVLKSEWNIAPEKTYVAAGPSLCQSCAEFTDPAKELQGIDLKFFDSRRVDLRGIADSKLRSLGVPPDHIDRHPDCTRCMQERYWSYRGGDKNDVIKGSSNMLLCQILQ